MFRQGYVQYCHLIWSLYKHARKLVSLFVFAQYLSRVGDFMDTLCMYVSVCVCVCICIGIIIDTKPLEFVMEFKRSNCHLDLDPL